jgi:hypothetical protein
MRAGGLFAAFVKPLPNGDVELSFGIRRNAATQFDASVVAPKDSFQA